MNRAPTFWWARRPSTTALLLSPAAFAWGSVAARRMRRPGWDCGIPVICIGNFVAGGAGKTPVAIAAAEILKQAGAKPFFLSRGYGGRAGTTPVIVDPASHRARDIGDEPLLLVQAAPTIVCADRIAGAKAAIQNGATAIVMDDGLQNPSLRKRLGIAVVDAALGAGNGMCIPAGPLRAPMEAQWPEIGALISLGREPGGSGLREKAREINKPVFDACLQPDSAIARRLAGLRIFAFAGIGHPEKFFATLAETGAVVVGTKAFGDHHAFTRRELEELSLQAQKNRASLITTEKDAARLPSSFKTEVLPVRAVFSDPLGFAALIVHAAKD